MLNQRWRSVRSRAEYTMVRQLLRLPAPLLQLLSGGAQTAGSGRSLSPEMQVIAFADRFMPRLQDLPPPLMRRRFEDLTRMLVGDERPAVFSHVRTVELDSPAGGRRELAMRFYTPQQGPFPKPVVVYYHGGGWCIGNTDTHDAFCQLVCAQADVIVVSVAYRLAPEHPFPAGVEDAIDAYGWVCAHAADVAGRPDGIVVAGDSAGGNLAAVVAQQARVRGLPQPQGQVLIYPAVELARRMASHEELGEGYVLTADLIRWFVDSYLGVYTSRDHPLASPYCAEPEFFQGLAPAVVVTAGFDPLRDEGAAYARRLEAYGNHVVHEEFPHMMHGFCGMFGVSPDARAACERVVALLRDLLVPLR